MITLYIFTLLILTIIFFAISKKKGKKDINHFKKLIPISVKKSLYGIVYDNMTPEDKYYYKKGDEGQFRKRIEFNNFILDCKISRGYISSDSITLINKLDKKELYNMTRDIHGDFHYTGLISDEELLSVLMINEVLKK